MERKKKMGRERRRSEICRQKVFIHHEVEEPTTNKSTTNDHFDSCQNFHLSSSFQSTLFVTLFFRYPWLEKSYFQPDFSFPSLLIRSKHCHFLLISCLISLCFSFFISLCDIKLYIQYLSFSSSSSLQLVPKYLLRYEVICKKCITIYTRCIFPLMFTWFLQHCLCINLRKWNISINHWTMTERGWKYKVHYCLKVRRERQWKRRREREKETMKEKKK